MLRKGGYYNNCLGNFGLSLSGINADMEHDIPSLGKTLSDIKCLACVSSVHEWPHFHFCLHQNQLMAQHGSAAALLPVQSCSQRPVCRRSEYRCTGDKKNQTLSLCPGAARRQIFPRGSSICTSESACQPESAKEST